MSILLDAEVHFKSGGGKAAETIFALASGALPSAVAVIRASGAEASMGLSVLIGDLPPPRRAVVRNIRDPRDGELLDRALVLWMPGPASFTGEDVFELHVHGGRAVVAAVMSALGELDGFRPAEPGEFTRRAFVAGRMDLTEAEAVADIVAADTEGQRRAALQQMGGSIRNQYESWTRKLLHARAMIEAELDFSDEEGVAGAWAREGRGVAASVLADMERGLDGFKRARLVREGFEIMLLGRVNAGKSTLLNVIAGRDIAIVSDEAGTTRDLIEVVVELAGYRVTLIDGAGLRSTEAPVEQEGIRRALRRAGEVDLVLWLSAEGEPVPAELDGLDVWRVATKLDLDSDEASIRFRNEAQFGVSSSSGVGIDGLLKGIADWAKDRVGTGGSLATRERHRAALAEASGYVRGALTRVDGELAAEDLRCATDSLGRVTGRVGTEDVLDLVFGEFCIGK